MVRAYCTYRVMTFGHEREAEEEVDEARWRQGRDQREREGDLEDQIRGVARAERRERCVRGRDDRIIVHAAASFVHEVGELEDRGDVQEALHAREAISETNSATALSI